METENIALFEASNFTELRETNYILQRTNGRKLLSSPHRHDFYEIIYMIAGTCTQVINEESITFTRNKAVILRPGDIHAFSSQSEHADLLALSVCGEEMDKFISAYGDGLKEKLYDADSAPVFTLTDDQRYELLSEYDRVAFVSSERRILHDKIILGKIIHAFLSGTDAGNAVVAPGRFSEAIRQMRMFDNIAEGMPALIRLSNFSPAQLSRLMKKYAGITPHQFIFNLKMNGAYELLRNSTLDLESISEKVGYASFSHFNKAFKAKFGISPAKLRKEYDLKII